MLDFSSTGLLLLGMTAAANLVLGSVIYFGDTKSVTRRYFFLLTVSIVIFNAAEYASYSFHQLYYTIWLLRFVIFFSMLFGTFFFLLALNFPENGLAISRKYLRLIYGVALAVMVLSLSPLVFSGVSLVHGQVMPTTSWGIVIFGAAVIFYDLGGIWVLVRKIKGAQANQRTSYALLLFGFLSMLFLIIIFNFLFPNLLNDTTYIPYSSVFSVPFVALTAFAIVRYNLMNIKLIATEIFTFLLALVTVFQIIFAHDPATILFYVSLTIFVLVFGILLIRSVRNEVQQREQLQELTKELAAANEKLKELDKAKNEFLSISSHQLRTPLTAIKGYVSMLREGDFGTLNEQQAQQLKIVADSATRLLDLIADLLDLSRIESGRMQFDFTAVNLCEIVDSVLQELSAKAKSKGLYLYFDNVNRSCPMIAADADKIRQVIVNLIDNAVKYTLIGGVTVSVIRVGSELQFSVADTGIGISEEEKKLLFEKYFRTDEAIAATKEGTGLGIYVVKKIVEAHQGKISLESPGLGKGTTFKVMFPIPDGPIEEKRVSIANLEAM